MKKLVKGVALVAAATMACAALAACGDGNGGKKASATAPDPASITATLQLWGPANAKTAFENIISEFNKIYPNITVNITEKSEADTGEAVSKDPETAGDVFIYPDDQFNVLMKQKALQPLPDYVLDGADNIKDADGKIVFDGVRDREHASSFTNVTYENKIWSFPATSDNGYFLMYDKRAIADDKVGDLQTLIDTVKSTNKRIYYDISNGFYGVGFFFAEGCRAQEKLEGSVASGSTLTSEFTTDFDSEAGLRATKDMIKYYGIKNTDNKNVLFGLNSGDGVAPYLATVSAFVSGTWDEQKAIDTWGAANVGYAKLPTYTNADGKTLQLGSFMGGKYVGVNSRPATNKDAAFAFANFLTNEASQLTRFATDGAGPSNKNAQQNSAVAQSKALKALFEQNGAGGVTQPALAGPFWTAMTTFCTGIEQGQTTNTNAQTALTKLVTDMKGLA